MEQPPASASNRSEEAGHRLLLGVGEVLLVLIEVGLPVRRVPHLDAVVGPDHHAVLLQPRVRTQRGRDRDPTLTVWYFLRGAGEEDAAVAAQLLVGDRPAHVL